MNRITTIILIVILVALVGVGVWWWLNKDETPTANANQSANLNVNSTARLEGGSLVVEKQITYQSLALNFTTALEDTSFHSQTAESGKMYFIVFFDPVEIAAGSEMPGWLNTDVSLTSGDSLNYPPTETKSVVKGTTALGDQGYFWFTVADSAQDYSLKFGTGEAATTLDLGV